MRGEQIKAERRRRNTDALEGKRRKLSVSEQNLDRENFVYRFANDEGNRIHDLTVNDDWEVVPQRNCDEKTDGMGADISRYAGKDDRGQAVRAVLLRKKKDWHEDDKRAAQRRIDETEAAIRQGATPGVDSGQLRPTREGIQLEHGSRA
jgi:hypothetical protein